METVRWPIRRLMDIVDARRHGRELALALGFALPEATKTAVIISELARHILENAQEGTITLVPHGGQKVHIEILAHMQGHRNGNSRPTEGIRSAAAGEELRGAEQLANEFEIHTVDGGGTAITAVMWLR
jgi:anti-sigma regulatory factor (Ser/Thr protein kinase)